MLSARLLGGGGSTDIMKTHVECSAFIKGLPSCPRRLYRRKDLVSLEELHEECGNIPCEIFPRYHWEERSRKVSPVWLYPSDRWVLPDYQYDDAKHGELRSRLTLELTKVMETH